MSSYEELEARLTLKDRLNFPYLISNAILTFQRALLNVENPEAVIKEAILGLVKMIPKEWHDDEFQKERETAKVTKLVDQRPGFCGKPASLEWCKARGIEPYKKETTFNFYALFHATINLLQRRGLLARKNYLEIMEGVPANQFGGDLPDFEGFKAQ